jgi:hypothetical protein
MYSYLQVYSYYLILNTVYTGPLLVEAQYSKLCPISSSIRYNDSLVTWTVVCLTSQKSYSPVHMGRPFWREDGSVFCQS